METGEGKSTRGGRKFLNTAWREYSSCLVEICVKRLREDSVSNDRTF